MSKSAPPARLGRGLSSLIKIPDQPVQSETSQVEQASLPSSIPLNKVHPNPHQPRRLFNDQTLAELAASIKSAGIIQPIIVRETESGYELIAGERRWRAAQLAGLTEIPAVIRQVDSFTQAQMALIENIQREDLNPLDRAHAYQSLIDQLGLTQNELAVRLGEERSSVANVLRLLALVPAVQEFVRTGKLSLGHAKILAGIPDPTEQERLGELAVQRELPVRALEQLSLAPASVPKKETATLRTSSAHISELEKSITRQLGLRSQIRQSAQAGKGKLVIHYTDLDQFDELLRRLQIDSPQA